MPKLVNRNSHAVRARDENGVEHRLRSGQVVDASGPQADALKGIANVESANKSDEEAWDRARGRKDRGDSSATIVHVTGVLTQARVAGRMASVVVPLNEVVGDDAAPLGPPSGTITTKQAVAREGQLENEKFGQRERLPEDAENERLPDVERKQAENIAVLEEVHNEVLEEASSAVSSAPDDDSASEKE
jgi:hypothetical protein